MVVKYLVTFYFICAMVHGAPPLISNPRKTSSPTEMERKPPVNSPFFRTIPQPKPSQNSINYETRGGAFQGDMRLPKGSDLSKFRGVAKPEYYRWPNGIIPYDISAITSSEDRNMITNAMQTLMFDVGTPIPGKTTSRDSCVYFRPKSAKDRSFVKIEYGTGCSATVGYVGEQGSELSLDKEGCFDSGTIQHELMHVLGFDHEQSRGDRDRYITVKYNNIQLDSKDNFDKLSWGKLALDLKTPYDYGSLMHYGSKDFSRNGEPTIVSKKSGVKLGQREKLSPTDIAEVRSYYNCLKY